MSNLLKGLIRKFNNHPALVAAKDNQTIEKMSVGDSGWITYMSIAYDNQERLKIRSGANVYEEMGGTINVFVVKEKSGFTIDISNMDEIKKLPNQAYWHPVNRILLSGKELSRIPEDTMVKNKSLDSMQSGETMWCLEWDIGMDEDRNVFIAKNASLRNQPGGTVNTRIIKTTDGFEIGLEKRENAPIDTRVDYESRSMYQRASLNLDGMGLDRNLDKNKVPMGLGDHENTIAEMAVGDYCWTVPWNISRDIFGTHYVSGTSRSNQKEPGGTLTVLVERKEDGYHLNMSGCPADARINHGRKLVGSGGLSVKSVSMEPQEISDLKYFMR